MTDRDTIKNFVQCTLGCTCPEEVFDDIEQQLNPKLNNEITLDEKLKIGRRLLIYILTINDRERLMNELSVLIRFGLNERDAIGFNRFRLVVKTDRHEDFTRDAESIFRSMNLNDDKVHLHIIPGERKHVL